MDPITLVIAIAAGAFALGMIASKNFRDRVLQTLRIKSNSALDKATTALEREKDEYQRLVALLPVQRKNVANVMANASQAQKDLDNKRKTLGEIESKYSTAVKMGASDAAKTQLKLSYSQAKDAVAAQEKILSESQNAAEEARKALDATIEALNGFADRIEADENKTELASALRVSAQARQQASEINSRLSRAGEASREIDRDLEQARAENDLSKGSAVDQEIADLEKKAKADAAGDELDRKLGLK